MAHGAESRTLQFGAETVSIQHKAQWG